ncbi:MAG TPA: hypothetical protein DCX01_02130 [Bacteroidetes bacterium]|jgi:hypothetical protein|nr:hypothetical protein [Bacteroidota bacterium]
MKIRALAIIDLDVEGGFREAANVEDGLNKLIKEYASGLQNVVHYQVDVRDRRGDNPPDIKKLKFRAN